VIGFRMRREARGRTDAVEPTASPGPPAALDENPRDRERAVGR
jgi:hypothetical protein